MNQVTPGDVSQSYLSHKVHGDQDTLATQCVGCIGAICTPQQPCGISMPYLNAPLPNAQIDLIDGWIAAGAPDN
jgi:hypothetical protein